MNIWNWGGSQQTVGKITYMIGDIPTVGHLINGWATSQDGLAIITRVMGYTEVHSYGKLSARLYELEVAHY